MKVFVSGCYDLLHSGHVEFFRQASQYGDLYVGIGSDATILRYKHHKTLYPEQERLFMVKSIRYVTDAFINQGDGVMDFIPTVEALKPDRFVVNADGSNEEKRRFCQERGIEYIVLDRIPADGLEARSSTAIKEKLKTPSALSGISPVKGESHAGSGIPTRLDLAGTWIDQPYVSTYAPGWALTISLEPTFEIRERCGLSTSTRNQIKRIWPIHLPDMDLESHLCMVPMFPRRPGCSVVDGKDITEPHVKALATAAAQCWDAIMQTDLDAFAAAYRASFEAQITLFPAMIQPGVQEYIDQYSAMKDVLAWKMPGAGGGGYLALVVNDATTFCQEHEEAIPLYIRRPA